MKRDNKTRDPNMKLSYCVTEDDYMKKRIRAYLAFIDSILAGSLPVTASFDIDGKHASFAKKDVAPTRKEYELLLIRHLEQIAFFSHERLVHLIVMVLFAILAFTVFVMTYFAPSIGLIILFAVILVLLIPYIMHYYTLENGVQKMYRQYDEIVKRMK